MKGQTKSKPTRKRGPRPPQAFKPGPYTECECNEVHPKGCHGHVKLYDEDENYVGRRPCKLPPIAGHYVCHKHGGGSPQVKKAAARRLLELVDPALAVLDQVMHDKRASHADRVRAAQVVLDRNNETARVSKQEITGAEGGPIEVDDPRARQRKNLERMLADPKSARRLDRTARDLYVVRQESGDKDEETG